MVIIEVGSSTTKAYLCENDKINKLKQKTILFKNHYKLNNKLEQQDKNDLFEFVLSINDEEIHVYGTSIFRNLTFNERKNWLIEFNSKTGLDFNIVSAQEENEYTVYGAIANTKYNGNIAVMIGGGGSTEIAVTNNGKIIKTINESFGAMDVTDNYPSLKDNFVKEDYKEMVNKTVKLMDKQNQFSNYSADILILAGGDYLYFYDELNYKINKNEFYSNPLQPYCLNMDLMTQLDFDFFYNVNLEDICKKTGDYGWWLGARGMRICVNAVCQILNVKYIIPTRITMVYGIVERLKNS